MQCYNYHFSAMGSSCEIKLYASNRQMANDAAHDAIEIIVRLEQHYSRYMKNNRLDAINQTAKTGGSIIVDEETAGLLNYADCCFHSSEGLFDITSGILNEAWDFSRGRLPDAELIDALLPRVGWNKVEWHPPRLSFFHTGIALDFGGIVKEYAADRCATQCLQAGICHGLINLGGDIRIIGPHPEGTPWRVGIRHPRDRNRYIRELEVCQGGVCSSGDYERCIRIDDRHYSHILNPKTGWPVTGLAAVTVIADVCLVAGSVSTMAMLKEQEAKKWLKDSGLTYLWIDLDGAVGETEGLSLR